MGYKPMYRLGRVRALNMDRAVQTDTSIQELGCGCRGQYTVQPSAWFAQGARRTRPGLWVMPRTRPNLYMGLATHIRVAAVRVY